MNEADKPEFLYQEFLRILNFNPEKDILKIDGDWVHIYKWVASNNVTAMRKILEEIDDEEV